MKSCFTVFCILMFFATSIAQMKWTKDPNNPILSGGAAGTWNSHVSSPMVLYNSDSLRYEMWFHASDGPPTWEPYLIGFATSYDGINWTKLDTAVLKPDPGTWDEKLVTFPLVIRENGAYKMWYTGWQGNNPGAIGYATSPDGVNWTKYPSNPVMTAGTAAWETGGPHNGYVMAVPGGGYKMWYTGYDVNYTIGKIGYATSADGITWTKADSVNPVLTTGSPGCWDDAELWTPCVLFINNTYHMWYSGMQAAQIPRQTGWATSADGIHWNKYNDPSTTSTLYFESDPVLKPSSAQWDGNYAQVKTVILEGDSLRMWYAGGREPTGTNLWRIGHATSPFRFINVPNQYATIQGAIDAADDGNVVLVDEGTYYENINFKGKAITVASHLYLDGDTSHISKTIIDGSQPTNPDSGSVVYLVSGEDTTSVLMGFTITNGTGTNSHYTYGGVQYPFRGGGGIFCENSGGRFVSNKIVNNTITGDEPFGGGLTAGDYGSDAWVILEKNSIINNTLNGGIQGAFGGGVGLACNGRIVDNVISYNSCNSTGNESAGGGIYINTEQIYPRTVIIKGNQITHNFVQGKGTQPTYYWSALGGGIYNDHSKILVSENEICHNQLTDVGTGNGSGSGIYTWLAATGSVISRNTISFNKNEVSGTKYGGGISLASNDVPVYNNIITGNSASHGGGIYCTYDDPEIINNTIVNNTASTSGGGLYASNSNPVVINTILWDNQAPTGPQISGSATVRYSDVQGGRLGEGNIDVDPYFSTDTLYGLSDSSHCIDAGDTNRLDPEDLNNPGFPLWPAKGTLRSDMGSYGGFDLIDAINIEMRNLMPARFYLKQNYPNPFNPLTTIEFSIPKTEFVKLKIFNLLGQEVATLVSNKLNQGIYNYQFNGQNLASGIYYYEIIAGEYREVKKMILLR